MALDKKVLTNKITTRAIKKVGNGYEVDGIKFSTREVAEQYCKINEGESETGHDFVNNVPNWVDEKIDYVYDSETENLPFKSLVEKYAQAHSLNLSMVAERLEVSRQALFNWTSGEKMPDSKNIRKICTVFKIEEEEANRALLPNFVKTNSKMLGLLEKEDLHLLIFEQKQTKKGKLA